MKIETAELKRHYAGGRNRYSETRASPAVWEYNYLALTALRFSIEHILTGVSARMQGGLALDFGAGQSPYRAFLTGAGAKVETIDPDPATSPDHLGTAEATGLASERYDLLLCTQVLEHCEDPQKAVTEAFRLLKPGGALVVSVPHVWFYHPHPSDNWRFTPEGLEKLCQRAGFRVPEIRCDGGSILTFAQVVNFLVYGAVGALGAPIFILTNVLGRLLDRLAFNPYFPLDVACLAVKPHPGAS